MLRVFLTRQLHLAWSGIPLSLYHWAVTKSPQKPFNHAPWRTAGGATSCCIASFDFWVSTRIGAFALAINAGWCIRKVRSQLGPRRLHLCAALALSALFD